MAYIRFCVCETYQRSWWPIFWLRYQGHCAHTVTIVNTRRWPDVGSAWIALVKLWVSIRSSFVGYVSVSAGNNIPSHRQHFIAHLIIVVTDMMNLYYIHKTFVYHLCNAGPTSKTLGRRCTNVIQIFCTNILCLLGYLQYIIMELNSTKENICYSLCRLIHLHSLPRRRCHKDLSHATQYSSQPSPCISFF